MFFLPLLEVVDVALINTEPVKIGVPVLDHIGDAAIQPNNRRLLQLTCPENMILVDGQCVCAQPFYSSANGVPWLVLNLHFSLGSCSGLYL
jgi:hypothetical protein